MKTIVCLYGGPSTGKTTVRAGVFFELKARGITAEENPEYIKNWVWEERKVRPGDQTYFFAKQARKERVCMQEGVEYIVNDSPLILTHFYGMKYDIFEQAANTSLIMLKHHHEICKHYGYKVEHFYLPRVKEYDPKGRYQTEDEAKQIDVEIKDMLVTHGIKFIDVQATNPHESKDFVVSCLLGKRNEPKIYKGFI